MYRFLTRPRWIAFHLLVIALVVLMVNLGFWQLRRYHERHDANVALAERSTAPAVPVTEIPDRDVAGAEWRTVTATGRYDAAGEVLVRNRSFNGAAGFHVVTPLVAGDGTAVLVNRGWIPVTDEAAVPPPTAGTVSIEGRVRVTQVRGSFGPQDPPEGTLTRVARIDVARLQQQLPYPVRPFYVELTAQQPPAGDLPLLIPLPERDDGPHLSYAVQWWIFSACAVVGWVVVVRKSAKGHARAAAAEPVSAPPA